jgi:hypothetical protein
MRSMNATQQLDVSVLSAPLAAIDRRSLSQAWYSALHLAHDAAPVAETKRCPAPAMTVGALVPRPVSGSSPIVAGVRSARAAGPSQSSSRAAGAFERRSARTRLAVRIERALTSRPLHATRTALIAGPGGTRVILVLRGGGAGLALVAVCAPSSRRTVARALEQARFALAARGIALSASVQGEAACS